MIKELYLKYFISKTFDSKSDADRNTLPKRFLTFDQLLRTMKKLLFFLSAVLILTSCSTGTSEYAKNGNDTIQTESGLRYIYTKKGTGQKVEEGSYVTTMLSLTVEDSVVWTSYNSPDSVFAFIVGHNPVIPGFKEMALLMQEGDNVYVSIPDSLAYGDKGTGGGIIPPNATIIYDRYEMVSVTEPKLVLTDTLEAVLLQEGSAKMHEVFRSLTDPNQSEKYHHILLTIQPVMNRLINASDFQTLYDMLAEIKEGSWTMNESMYGLYLVLATEGIGDIDGAISIAEEILANDSTQFLIRNKLVDLESKRSPK